MRSVETRYPDRTTRCSIHRAFRTKAGGKVRGLTARPGTLTSGVFAATLLPAGHHPSVPLDVEADRQPGRADKERLRPGHDLEPDHLVPPVVVVHEVGGVAVHGDGDRVDA